MASRIQPPGPDRLEPHAPLFAVYEQIMGFVPESAETMARVPGLLEGYAGLAVSIVGSGLISEELAQLVAHVTSTAAGCRYCQAHTIAHAEHLGVDAGKLQDLWTFETSERFTEAERAALGLALHAGQHPNAVDDADIEACRIHYDDDQITALVAICALFGFLNRWNDSLATTLEPPARVAAERHLVSRGWTAGKHTPDAGLPDDATNPDHPNHPTDRSQR